MFSFLFPFFGVSLAADGIEGALAESVGSIEGHASLLVDQKWAEWALEYVQKIVDIITPVIIMLGVAIVFLWAYKLMVKSDTSEFKNWVYMVIFGVVGIIIMVSANFLSDVLVNGVIWGSFKAWWGMNGVLLAQGAYENIMLPFVKLGSFMIVWILFFVLVSRVFKFLTSQDEGVRKQATGLITWTVIGILVILASNQLVTAVFGESTAVLNDNASDLSGIWSAIFETAQMPILYQVINWVMGLAAFIVLLLIVFRTFQMLTKPDDPKMFDNIKKTLLYVLIGVVVIGAGYLISNVLLVN